jgi:pimeloyl-ACP methyl ester carboxylesterase
VVSGDGGTPLQQATYVHGVPEEETFIRQTLPFLRSLIKRVGLIEEGNGSVSLTDLFRLAPVRFEENPEPASLVAEKAPADATHERGTLVLVHGNYWKDAIGQKPEPSERAFLFAPFRADPRYEEIRRKYRVFIFQYPTHLDVVQSAAALATHVRNVLPAGVASPDLTVIAHSLGGLVARHALQGADLAGRVRDLITLAAPHHGTVLASLVMANTRIREKVGLFGLFCQRMSRRVWPITPGLRGMAYDNWDGLIPPGEADRYGIFLNRTLAELNRGCRVAQLERLENRNLFDQVPRVIMGRLNPIYRGLDPLVHFESGMGMGLKVRDRLPLDGLDHETIVTSPKSRDALFDLLLR